MPSFENGHRYAIFLFSTPSGAGLLVWPILKPMNIHTSELSQNVKIQVLNDLLVLAFDEPSYQDKANALHEIIIEEIEDNVAWRSYYHELMAMGGVGVKFADFKIEWFDTAKVPTFSDGTTFLDF